MKPVFYEFQMNYRHHFHAGNFADVAKHALLVQLMRGLQRKEKGFLYLDTHAGRGAYDLAAAERGDSLARKPEHPEGIGRLAEIKIASSDAQNPPDALVDYLRLVRDFDRSAGSGGEAAGVRFYPGSPRLVSALLRPQDRMVLCEKHPDEFLALCSEFREQPRVSVQEIDGYEAVRGKLPAPEKRALVLIDPPFEAQDEYEKILHALREGLRRMAAATFAVWYPLTERARADEFLGRLAQLNPPPMFAAELTVAGEDRGLKMRGCGLAVVNPPWQSDRVIEPLLKELAKRLAQAPGGEGHLEWIVRE